jgi:hypothetical protein
MDRDFFHIHLLEIHHMGLTKDQIAFISRTCVRRAPIFSACVFCNNYAAPDQQQPETQNALTCRETKMLKCMETHMISFALISLPDNLSVSNDSASSHARVSDLSRASVTRLVVQQSMLNVDSLPIAQFKEELSQRDNIGSTADRNNEVDRWRLESNLRGLNNRPEDHDLLLVDRDNLILSTESQKYDDCIGDGPPLYDGNPLSFQGKGDGVRSAADQMSPPAISIDYAPPARRNTVNLRPSRSIGDGETLSPPIRRKLLLAAVELAYTDSCLRSKSQPYAC